MGAIFVPRANTSWMRPWYLERWRSGTKSDRSRCTSDAPYGEDADGAQKHRLSTKSFREGGHGGLTYRIGQKIAGSYPERLCGIGSKSVSDGLDIGSREYGHVQGDDELTQCFFDSCVWLPRLVFRVRFQGKLCLLRVHGTWLANLLLLLGLNRHSAFSRCNFFSSDRNYIGGISGKEQVVPPSAVTTA
ncbi:hypothetical protein KC353_g71 [Hortaea werneckii]|nr:hypothetical protein KC353_g71 [Hortaea werneckii]